MQDALNALGAARDCRVERFLNIAIDKAANPTSVLGRTKSKAEQLTAWMAEQRAAPTCGCASATCSPHEDRSLTAFRAQVEAVRPITVSHPDGTRYFMTVQEAVQLVIQAGAIGRDGEALSLHMGQPVRIGDVARRMADSVDPPLEIVYTGLRPGEKLHEELFGEGEPDLPPLHPLVPHLPVALASEQLPRHHP